MDNDKYEGNDGSWPVVLRRHLHEEDLRNRDYYEEAMQPAVCYHNGEMNAKEECIQIAKYCHFKIMQYFSRKERKSSFHETLLGVITKGFVGPLSWRMKVGYVTSMQREFGLLRWKSIWSLLLYIILMMSSFSSASYYSDYVSLYMKNYSKSACDGEYLRISCPEGTSIDVQGAMYGRKVPSKEMCPSKDWIEGSGVSKNEIEEDTNCEAKTGAECQDQRICRLLVHTRVFGGDPCPGTSKYLSVKYQCAPKDFQRQSECVSNKVLLRCRQDTVISVYKVTPRTEDSCGVTNNSDCSMSKMDIFNEVSAKCHSKRRCYYTLPTAACFNRVIIVHTCVPKQYLTSELPTSERLYTTTTITKTTTTLQTTTQPSTTATADITEHSTREDSPTTVLFTVNPDFPNKGDPSTNSTSTSKSIATQDSQSPSPRNQGNISAATTLYQAISNTSFQVATDATKEPWADNEVIVRNEFPMIPEQSMGGEINTTQCSNCTNDNLEKAGGVYFILMRIYTFLKDNRDDILIAVLLGIVIALLIVICILVFRCKKTPKEHKERRETGETPENNRESNEEHYAIPDHEAPNQEDEHENMSLLGSILQSASVDSNHVSPRSKVNPEPEEGDKGLCGPKSIFAKICCNCCCNNAPWQPRRILKRPRGGVYKLPRSVSSSTRDGDETNHFRSHDTFPVFSRADDEVDDRSPIPVLEDHINRTEYPIVTSGNVTSQQSSDFRPISRNAQRHYSVTPEPDSQYRTQRSTFHPHEIHETQRSDPALNRYSVRPQHNPAQPLTAPTSPVINHHGNSNHAQVNGNHKLVRAYPAPKTLPVMGQSMLQTQHPPQTPQTPLTPKYTPPPSQYYTTQQYPTFTDAIEQYDNAIPQQKQMVVRRKQYSQRTAPDYRGQPNQYPYPRYNGHYPGYHHQNSYDGDHFVQAVARRTLSSTARAVELSANSRTIDLAHDNSLSRNSWLEIRRSSFYDNSLPRNSEMYEFYQQHLLHQQDMQHAPHLELPGSRNLNHYYP